MWLRDAAQPLMCLEQARSGLWRAAAPGQDAMGWCSRGVQLQQQQGLGICATLNKLCCKHRNNIPAELGIANAQVLLSADHKRELHDAERLHLTKKWQGEHAHGSKEVWSADAVQDLLAQKPVPQQLPAQAAIPLP